MHDLVIAEKHIETMTTAEIDSVCRLESIGIWFPQVKISTQHIIHAGMYVRTVVVPAGVVLTGSLMKIATILIIQGDFVLFIGGKAKELHGYNIFTGGPNRKQAGVAITDTHITMIFPTSARTVEEAEGQFTDEPDILFSRYPDAENHVIITGE